MPTPPPRRLNLLDGMILVAAVAAGIALTRFLCLENPYFDPSPPGVPVPRPPGFGANGSTLNLVNRTMTIWVATLSPTLLLIQLRRPRPVLSKVFRQPGTQACLATIAPTVLESVVLAFTALRGGLEAIHLLQSQFVYPNLSFSGGSSIIALWSTMFLTRQWHPERSSIDRIGRALGVCWIVVFLITTVIAIERALIDAGAIARFSAEMKAFR